MKQSDYPALYISASKSSVFAQALYFWVIKFEYILLILAATLALFLQNNRNASIAYAVVLVLSAGLLLFLLAKKPEKDWYGCRALAESIKTSTWRYMMRAEPFEDADSVSDVKDKFRKFLRDILETNNHIKGPISGKPTEGKQITDEMSRARGLSLDERKHQYLKNRIFEQRNWYIKKSKYNKTAFTTWIIVCVVAQFFAILLAFMRIEYYQAWQYWLIEPLLMFISSIVGWIQIKKFNELSSAYSLTEHEIGIVETRIGDVQNEKQFSEFVNEAERAFSREHTQWIARQND